MWRYDDVLIMTEVIKQGSFIKASEKLNIPSSTISRRVAAFESSIGVRLLERNSRKFSLTEKGKALFDQCHPQMQEIREAIEGIQVDNENPVGTLKVTAPVTLGNELLSPWFSDFAVLNPNINLDIVLSNHYEDIVDDSFDAAIRVGPLKDSNFIAQFLFSSNSILCVSPKYLKEIKTPIQRLVDIENYHFLSYLPNKNMIQLQSLLEQNRREINIKTRIGASSTSILRQAALDGLGITCLPKVSIQNNINSGELIHLFPDFIGLPKLDIYVVYPSKLHLSQKMKLFLEHLKKCALQVNK